VVASRWLKVYPASLLRGPSPTQREYPAGTIVCTRELLIRHEMASVLEEQGSGEGSRCAEEKHRAEKPPIPEAQPSQGPGSLSMSRDSGDDLSTALPGPKWAWSMCHFRTYRDKATMDLMPF